MPTVYSSSFNFREPTDSPGDVSRGARRLLRAFATSSQHIEACAVISTDGFILASVLSDSVDEDRFGAMCASLLSLSARAASEAQRGELRQVILDGTLGPMLLTRAGELGALAVATNPQANLGRVMIDTRRTAQDLAALVTPSAEGQETM